jgi:DNA-binding transcriptional ArsR family regulator
VLREAGLVRDRKAGRWSYYALNADRVAEIEAYARALAGPGGAVGAPALHQIAKQPPRRTRAAQDEFRG